MLRSTRLAAFATDDSCRIIAGNAAAESAFRLSRADMANRPCYELIAGRTPAGGAFCSRSCAMRRAAAAVRPIEPLTLRVRRVGGGTALANVAALVLPSSNGGSQVLLHLLEFDDEAHASAGGAAPAPRSRQRPGTDGAPLTPRESEVLARIAAGASVKELASELAVSNATVRTHVHCILRKLGVHRQIDAVLAAQRRGLLRPPRRRLD